MIAAKRMHNYPPHNSYVPTPSKNTREVVEAFDHKLRDCEKNRNLYCIGRSEKARSLMPLVLYTNTAELSHTGDAQVSCLSAGNMENKSVFRIASVNPKAYVYQYGE